MCLNEGVSPLALAQGFLLFPSCAAGFLVEARGTLEPHLEQLVERPSLCCSPPAGKSNTLTKRRETLANLAVFRRWRRRPPPVCVWPALVLCSLWLVSSPSLPLLSSGSLHLKPWPYSQNVPSVSLHLNLLGNTEELV